MINRFDAEWGAGGVPAEARQMRVALAHPMPATQAGGILAKYDISELRFFESAENVRHVITDTFGKTPNAEVARNVAVCIQQGRMFFESADTAGMEIRPLLLYYGMMAFAKAVIVGRRLKPLNTLSHGHGLKDKSSQTARLAELVTKVTGDGTFQEFNDVVRENEGVAFIENYMTTTHSLPTATAADLFDCELTLKNILARIPGLENLYHATFKEQASLLQFSISLEGGPADCAELRIDVPEIYQDLDSLRKIVGDLRGKFPTLRHWRFSSAERVWDKSMILFRNMVPIENEFAPKNNIESDRNGITSKATGGDVFVDFRTLLNFVNGRQKQGFPAFVEPLNGTQISDVSLQYAGMFLLSSLVRYRPQIWVHSLSRFSSHERPADDQALALIESFMRTVQNGYPDVVTRLLTQV